MAGPITWQNVTGPSMGDPSRMLLAAQNGFSGAFDSLSKALSDQQGANQFAQDQSYGAATLAFKEALNNARTPEELAALQSSGRLETMRGALNNKGREAVLGAETARLGSLQQQTTTNNAFTDAIQKREQQPLREAIAADIAAGRTQEAQAKIAANPQLRDTAPLLTSAYDTGRSRAANVAADELAKRTAPTALINADTANIDAVNGMADRTLATATANASQQYQLAQTKERMKLSPIAKRMGLPLDSSGAPDVLNMTTEQRMYLDDQAIRAGFKPTSELYSGDTKASNAFIKSIVESGKYTPEAIARNASKMTGAFSSVSNNASVGNDALAIDRAQAQAEVVQKERDARNRFAPGTPDALNTYEKLATDIENHASFKDSPEDVQHVQSLLQEMSTKGLEVSPGKFITPSAQDVMAAVRSTSEGWNLLNSGRSKDIKAKLVDSLKGANVTELLRQAEESKMSNRQRAVRDILNPITPAVQPLNPLDLPKPGNTKR